MKTIASMMALMTALGCSGPALHSNQAPLAANLGPKASSPGQIAAATVVASPGGNPSQGPSGAVSKAGLPTASGLTLRTIGSGASNAKSIPGRQAQCRHATRTVLVVQRGCVLVHLDMLSKNSVFELDGAEVASLSPASDLSATADGKAVMMSGPVTLAAGEPEAIEAQEKILDTSAKAAPLVEASPNNSLY